ILMRTLALLSMMACATTSNSSVAVEGNDVDVSLLAGKWEGTYEGSASGRKGSVSLDLTTGNRVAEGKVMMNSVNDPQNARELTITFMKVGGRKLLGTITPYTDPQCNCTVETEFSGTLTGDTIAGSFSSAPQGKPKQVAGNWSATRKR